MSTYIHGWVEVNTIEMSTESIWFGVLDIGIVVSQNYSIYNRLFGVRDKNKAIAANRGMPQDASFNSKQDLMCGIDMVKQTWMGFQEYHTVIGELIQNEYDWGWQLLDEFMNTMALHYGKENVRLVVAFDNGG